MKRIAGPIAVTAAAFILFVVTRPPVESPKAGRPDAPPTGRESPRLSPSETVAPDPEIVAGSPVETGPPAPYPLAEFPPGWNAAMRRTLEALRTPASVALAQAPLADLASSLAGQTGIPILIDPDLPPGSAGPVSITVKNVFAEGILRLACSPLDLDHEIRTDGVLFISIRSRISRRHEKALAENQKALAQLETVRAWLDDGWDGKSPDFHPETDRFRKRLTQLPVSLAASQATIEDLVQDLVRQTGTRIVLDSALAGGCERSSMARADLSAVGPLSDVLDQVAVATSTSYQLVDQDTVLFTTAERAAHDARLRAEGIRLYEEHLRRLQQPISAGVGGDVPAVVQALETATGLKILLSRMVWEGGALLPVRRGATAQAILDDLCARAGARWAIFEGRICVVR